MDGRCWMLQIALWRGATASLCFAGLRKYKASRTRIGCTRRFHSEISLGNRLAESRSRWQPQAKRDGESLRVPRSLESVVPVLERNYSARRWQDPGGGREDTRHRDAWRHRGTYEGWYSKPTLRGGLRPAACRFVHDMTRPESSFHEAGS